MLRRTRVETGWVVGIPAADPRITAYKGIPFAAPPTGRNPLAGTAAGGKLGGRPPMLYLWAHVHAAAAYERRRRPV